jgi:2-polyprenyl-3-methyl-5-hydroxy-6-metoxy-1,4-benzoquinol methylase
MPGTLVTPAPPISTRPLVAHPTTVAGAGSRTDLTVPGDPAVTIDSSSNRAAFTARECCIACRSKDLEVIDSGKFSEDPLRTFIEEDPWGESPLPYLGDHAWEYVGCVRCGQRFHKSLLTPEWQEVRFSRWMSEEAIHEFERRAGTNSPRSKLEKGIALVRHALRLEKMTRPIRGEDAVRLLDFGCGWGEFPALANLLGFEAYGVDRSPARQETSRGRGAVVFPDLDAVAEAVGQGFHAITLFQVLEHVEEPLELLVALHERMVPGAVLVLEVPDCQGVEGLKSRSDYFKIHPLEHINCFTSESLRKIARRAGFRPVLPAIAHATTDAARVVKGEARRWVQPFRSPGTDRYFRRA